jgi:hypothetical protein
MSVVRRNYRLSSQHVRIGHQARLPGALHDEALDVQQGGAAAGGAAGTQSEACNHGVTLELSFFEIE